MLADEAKVLESETKRAETTTVSPRRGSPSAGHKDLYPPGELSNTKSFGSSSSRSRKGS